MFRIRSHAKVRSSIEPWRVASISHNAGNRTEWDKDASLPENLKFFAEEFDPRFDAYLRTGGGIPQRLLEAVRYSALAPGKRLRPFLVVRCCELSGGTTEDAWPIAAAMECVHAFSLIHDDLPAMDNDDLRRGRATNHKVFGEATAILAGDALMVLAFEIISRHVADGKIASQLVLELARGSGWQGMIGGQMADIESTSKPPDQALAQWIHERKTASLFRSACRLGAMVARAPGETIDALGRFGESLGLAFQIADDLLDVRSTKSAIGKAVGKDADQGKQSLPRCVGAEQSVALAKAKAGEAIEQLAALGPDADDLRALAAFVVDRFD